MVVVTKDGFLARPRLERILAGTTLDVIAVTTFEGKAVGDGRPGPVSLRLRELLLRDQEQN